MSVSRSDLLKPLFMRIGYWESWYVMRGTLCGMSLPLASYYLAPGSLAWKKKGKKAKTRIEYRRVQRASQLDI